MGSIGRLNAVLRLITPSKLLKITTLSNRLRVATDPFPSAETTICVGVDVGFRFDPPDAHGAVHLIYRRAKTCKELNAIGNVCGTLGDERIYVDAAVPKAKTLCALKLLAHSFQDSAFDDGVLETHESYENYKENNMAMAETHQVMLRHLFATAFGNSPLGRPPLRPDHNIGGLTRRHLKKFMSENFTGPRMVISVTGDVNHEDIVRSVDKLFTKVSDNPTTGSQLVAKAPATFTPSEVRMLKEDEPLAHFAIAFRGSSLTDSDMMSLKVIEMMLCSADYLGSADSWLINKQAGMVMTFNTNYHEIGLFGVHAEAEPCYLDRLAHTIMSSFSKLCSSVLDEDVIFAKDQLKSSLLNDRGRLAMATTEDLLMYGRRISLEEQLASVDAIDADTVRSVAKRFFYDQDIAISALGPIAELPDYEWFRSRTRLLHQ